MNLKNNKKGVLRGSFTIQSKILTVCLSLALGITMVSLKAI